MHMSITAHSARDIRQTCMKTNINIMAGQLLTTAFIQLQLLFERYLGILRDFWLCSLIEDIHFTKRT